VQELLRRLGEDVRAVEEGRVFCGKRRCLRGDEPVAVGDEVRVAPKQEAPEAPLTVLETSAERVVVIKPAGIPTIPDQTGSEHSLLMRVALETGVGLEGLHATSRLDREVSGVVIFARTKGARESLAQAREKGAYQRRYVAVGLGTLGEKHGCWAWPIGRAKDPRHRQVGGREAVDALTRFQVVEEGATCTLLALGPVTGRTHQLRVHAAQAGVPLVGDRVYGAKRPMVLPSGKVLALARVALHAARVRIVEPNGTVSEYVAPLPPELEPVLVSLGLDQTAWEKAVASAIPGEA
jgi:RluA family pseudouridine synthase